jgi:hypothetical protein
MKVAYAPRALRDIDAILAPYSEAQSQWCPERIVGD